MTIHQKKKLGELLKLRRIELGFTQEMLAKRLGVAQTYVTYLEKGQRKPSPQLMKKTAKVTGLTLDQLYRLSNPDINQVFPERFKPEPKTKLPAMLKKLKDNSKLRKLHKISDADIELLGSVKARGEIKKEEDYILLLMTIRQVFE